MRLGIGRLLVMFLLAWVVSGYLFSFGFTFLPASLNTKQIIGVLGILAFAIRAYREKSVKMSRIVVVSAAFAMVFSVWCFYSMMANETNDLSYATYIVSFAVWVGGAFGVISLLRRFHGYCNLKLITDYLIFVCIMQCVLSQLIDNLPGFQLFVDSYIAQGQDFLHEVNRLYGIGASLDPAGVRFSCVLVLLAHQVAANKWTTDNAWRIALYLLCLIVIVLLGNMISRTTIVGAGMALVYMFLMLGLSKRGILTYRQVRFYGAFIGMLILAIVVCTILYNSNPDFRHNMRFAFEGFFNFFEQGEFRTDSTDKLNGEMWIWPDNFRDWMIGTGIFGGWYYSTDIGYCRFVLYCGIIGLSIFSLYFVYNGLILNKRFKNFWLVSLFIVSLTFIIWVKVATDLFMLDALLFCVDSDYDEYGNEIDWNASPDDETEVDTELATT